MQIYIFGDLSFATFMLRGVSMLYSADGTFIQAALILSLLFLLWSFIKWSLNPEKTTYPVREWAFGLIFFLILGGTSLSPKFRVTLIHANHGASPATFVDDVPLLAAAPSWLATNLFRTITQRIETAGPFIMPGYEKFRGVGMSKPDADPLNALVKLNSLANTAILDRHFEIQVKDYIKQCYLPHIAFDPSFPALKFTKNNITQLEIWDDLLVSNVHLTITTTGQDGAPVTQSCIAFHANFKNSLTSDVPGTFRSSAAKAAASRNISEQEVRAGAQIIFENLTGSPGNPNPVNIMQNMFLIRSIKDSINTLPEAASLQTWTNKMVFEAERKRTFEAAGERSLFMKLYIPTITTIETFSFFIAPVLMILSVLGGYGFSLIGKYLMLVLFINLWSFIKVFVDIFTALSLATAFKQIGPVPDGSDINKFLGFETYAQTISEIESLLTVASNLTMAIPFFAIFLLYGGIHSVMGVMRTVTGGSVDGSNMAPTMATSMNSATMQMGDQTSSMNVATGGFYNTHSTGTHRGVSTINFGQTYSTLSSSTNQVLSSESATHTKQLTEAIGRTTSYQNQWSDLKSGTGTVDFSQMNMQQRLSTVAYAIQQGTTLSDQQALEHAMSLAAQGDGSVRFGGQMVGIFNAGVAAQLKASLNASGKLLQGEALAETRNKLENFQDSNGRTFSTTDAKNVADTKAKGDSGSDSRSYSQVDQSIDQLSRINMIQSSRTNSADRTATFLSNSTISHAALPEIDDAFAAVLSKHEQRLGLTTTTDPEAFLKANGGKSLNALQNLTQQHISSAKTLDEKAAAYENISQLWGDVAKRMFDPNSRAQVQAYSNLFAEEAKHFRERPEALSRDTNPDAVQQFKEAKPQVQGATPEAKQTVIDLYGNGDTRVAAGITATGNAVNAGRESIGKPAATPQELIDTMRNVGGDLATLRQDWEQNRSALLAGANFAKTLNSYVDKAYDWFAGPGELWGKQGQEGANMLATDLAQNGFYSSGAKQGFEALATKGTPAVQNAFNGKIPTADAFAMNDTLIAMRAQYGDNWADKIPNNTDGQRFLAAAGMFVSQKAELDPQMQRTMDAISMARLSGALPAPAADMLIANINKKDGPTPLSTAATHNSPERAAMAIIQRNSALRENKDIAYAAGYADSPIPESNTIPATTQRAADMFTNNEKQRITQALEYRIDPNEGFIPGVNRDLNDGRLETGLDNYLKPNGRSDGFLNALTDTNHPNHATALAVANSGMGQLAQRLEEAGFTVQAEQFKQRQTQDMNTWAAQGIFLTPERFNDLVNIGTAALNGQTEINTNGQVMPNASAPIQLESGTKLTYQGGSETNGIFSAAIEVPGYSSPVMITGGSRGVVFPNGAGASRDKIDAAAERIAASNFSAAATFAATAYGNIRGGFYNAMNQNDNQPPESFKSYAGDTFNLVSNTDGIFTYSSSNNLLGSYTFNSNQGEGEFRPSEDNPLFNRTNQTNHSRNPF